VTTAKSPSSSLGGVTALDASTSTNVWAVGVAVPRPGRPDGNGVYLRTG
jgi:hypothetical protein